MCDDIPYILHKHSIPLNWIFRSMFFQGVINKIHINPKKLKAPIMKILACYDTFCNTAILMRDEN